MSRSLRLAAFAACVLALPAAHAGDAFVNAQGGVVEADDAFDDDRSSLLQGSMGYRWGIGYAQVGLEGGVGKFGDVDARLANGSIERAYTLSSRYGFAGLNARVKPPLLPVFFVGRAGVLGVRNALDETVIDRSPVPMPVPDRGTFDRTDGGTYAGVGVGTTLLPLLDVGLMINQYRTSQVEYDAVNDEYRLSDDKRNARSVSLTVEYRF